MSGPDLDPIQQKSQAQFDRQSQRYAKGHILSDVSDVVAALAHVPARSGRALDVATGAGFTGLYLAEQGWQVTLADLSGAMLARASEGARERGLSVETRQHAAEALPYADGAFDLVTCRVAAHHFSDVVSFVRESARVLAPGGYFLLIDGTVADDEPVARAWLHQVEIHRDPSHQRLVTPREWRSHCEAAGLTVISCEVFPFKQPNLNWYFETAATSPENRAAVHELIRTAPAEAKELFKLTEEDGKIVWWWQRLSLVARK
jgi:ubiquinone/menaquinone biosynthesis C-methylase UbiE